MYDAPRAATVQATSDVSAWAIDRVTFKQVTVAFTIRKVRTPFSASLPCLLVSLSHGPAVQRDLYKAFLEKVPILETLTEGERLTIADALQPVSSAALPLNTCMALLPALLAPFLVSFLRSRSNRVQKL